MPSGEKQAPLSAKKVALRDLPSEINNFTSNLLDHSPIKDRGSIPGTAKLSGIKREQPSSPCTPHPQQHSSYSGHLVYVRRKLDIEPNKVCVENVECTDLPCSSNCWKDQSSETKSPKELEAKLSCVSSLFLSPASFISPLRSEPLPCTRKPGNLMPLPLTNHTIISSDPESETQSQCEGYWKERFIRLQLFLKNCDQSNQENYIQSLRSLSASGRSMHAIELEKRAIQLLLDEGRELQKMKVLNVLGKSLPDPQAFSPEPLAPEK